MIIDLSREQVRFRVAEGASFDEKQLGEAFATAGWKIKVLSRPGGADDKP